MNRQSFNQLIESNSTYLQPFAVSLTHNDDDAKDLVQETLYKAILNQEKFQDGTNVKAWLYTIMRNIFINNYRKLQKFRGVSTDTPQDFFLTKANKFAINQGISNTALMEIKSAVNDLPEILRIAFELHYIGYKYQEIAETLDEPLGTIKSRIHFARKILMTKLYHLK